MVDPGFALYVHWPFCQSKCPYCDFNSHVSGLVDADRWARAYIAEIDRAAIHTAGKRLDSIYFGGGTPSLMDPKVVEAVISAAQRHWRLANDAEITLEANPTSVEASRFAGYRAAGVNRVSVGVQALNDDDLKALGRLHSVKEALAALDIANSVFDRTNFDLIYARQNQSLSDWQDELSRALTLVGEHMSLYQLTIEPETAFGSRRAKGGLPGLPDEDLQADMFFLTQDLCESAGLPAYEISNHARDGGESQHNLTYWRGGDWVGIGPGAHGRLTDGSQRFSTEALSVPSAWLTAVESGQGTETRLPLSVPDAAIEYLMMGLRTREGVTLSRLSELNLSNKIKYLEGLGLACDQGGQLMLTPAGRPLLNAVLRELLAD